MFSILDGPQCVGNIKIMSWNINDVCTKLEKSNELQFREYDVIPINEAKIPLVVTFSGYKSYRSNTVGSGGRRGTIVLVKNWSSEAVLGVDASNGDQVCVAADA